jgi:hypothetical protein
MSESGSDIYRIDGPPEGVPVPVRFEFVIQPGLAPPLPCTCSPFGTYPSASMSDGAHSQSFNTCCGGGQVLSLDLQVLPGTDFQMWYSISEGSGVYPSHADVEARIQVLGLPASAILSSFHGVTTVVVPTKPTTWGLVKATYRLNGSGGRTAR